MSRVEMVLWQAESIFQQQGVIIDPVYLLEEVEA